MRTSTSRTSPSNPATGSLLCVLIVLTLGFHQFLLNPCSSLSISSLESRGWNGASPLRQCVRSLMPFRRYSATCCTSRVLRVSSSCPLAKPRLYSRDIGVLRTFKAEAICSAKMPKITKAAPTHQSTLQGMWGKKDKEVAERAKVIPDEKENGMDVDDSNSEKGE